MSSCHCAVVEGDREGEGGQPLLLSSEGGRGRGRGRGRERGAIIVLVLVVFIIVGRGVWWSACEGADILVSREKGVKNRNKPRAQLAHWTPSCSAHVLPCHHRHCVITVVTVIIVVITVVAIITIIAAVVVIVIIVVLSSCRCHRVIVVIGRGRCLCMTHVS